MIRHDIFGDQRRLANAGRDVTTELLVGQRQAGESFNVTSSRCSVTIRAGKEGGSKMEVIPGDLGPTMTPPLKGRRSPFRIVACTQACALVWRHCSLTGQLD